MAKQGKRTTFQFGIIRRETGEHVGLENTLDKAQELARDLVSYDGYLVSKGWDLTASHYDVVRVTGKAF